MKNNAIVTYKWDYTKDIKLKIFEFIDEKAPHISDHTGEYDYGWFCNIYTSWYNKIKTKILTRKYDTVTVGLYKDWSFYFQWDIKVSWKIKTDTIIIGNLRSWPKEKIYEVAKNIYNKYKTKDLVDYYIEQCYWKTLSKLSKDELVEFILVYVSDFQ